MPIILENVKAGDVVKDTETSKSYIAVLQRGNASNLEKPCLSCAFADIRLDGCPRKEFGYGMWWIACAEAPDGEDIIFKEIK